MSVLAFDLGQYHVFQASSKWLSLQLGVVGVAFLVIVRACP